MNILLIHPYINSNTPILYLNEPIGLISLASYITANSKSERNINILDLYALGHSKVKKDGSYYNIGVSEPKTIVRMVKEHDPDIIGITCNFTTYTKATFDLVNLLKPEFPKVCIVIGGAHVTIDANNILSNNCMADVAIQGEGEITFRELVERLDRNQSYFDVPGITYRKNGNIISNPRRQLIPDINILPIPNRKYIQQDVYSIINRKMYFLSKGRKVASLMTSRGCPFNCTFCSTKVVWERKFRPRIPRFVIEEMERLIIDYNIEEFLINDDQFYFDTKRVHAICDMIIERKWKIYLNVASGSSVWLMDEELLNKLKKAGLYRITFPIESGCKKTLKYVKKPIDLRKTKEIIKMANRLGLWTYANIIIGFPYENQKDIQETISYVNKSGLDFATYFIAKPYAGSQMYKDFQEAGLITSSDIVPTTMGEAGHDIVYMTGNELQKIRDKAQKQYFYHSFFNYMNPLFSYKYIYPKLNSIKGLLYFIRAIRDIVKIFVFSPLIQKLIKRND